MTPSLAKALFGINHEEWLRGEGVSTDEFNARYRPWLGHPDMGAEERPGGAGKAAGGYAGQLEADHLDAAADTAGEGTA